MSLNIFGHKVLLIDLRARNYHNLIGISLPSNYQENVNFPCICFKHKCVGILTYLYICYSVGMSTHVHSIYKYAFHVGDMLDSIIENKYMKLFTLFVSMLRNFLRTVESIIIVYVFYSF